MSNVSFLRIWRELKRRRVLTVCLAYLGGAWFAIEPVMTVLTNLGVEPETAGTVSSVITILALAAFPLVLLLTWMFQVVPDSQAPQDDEGRRPWRRHFVAFSVVLVSAGCVTLATMLWPPVTPARDKQPWEGRAREQDVLALLAPKLLLGDESAQEVADCIVRRLGDRLQTVPGFGLRPPAETAALAGEGLSYDSVAERLGVGTLITSTAEHTGGQFRMTLRILSGDTGEQLASVSTVGTLPDGDDEINNLVDSLETKVRPALGQVRPEWDAAPPPRDPASQERLQEALDELELYRRHLADQNIDAALGVLGRVDVVLAEASTLDPGWAEPHIRRSAVSRDRSVLLLTNDPSEARRALVESRRHADHALTLSPGNPEALRLRGLAAYGLATTGSVGAEVQDALLASADADLRRAQSRHPNRADVRYALALVKREQGLLPEALFFAEDAYTYDAFLRVSDRVLWELFDLSFQLSRDDEARSWCEEGTRRYPEAWTFAACRLTLMGWGIAPPDTTLASALTEEALSHYPPPFRGGLRAQLETLVAAVHFQAGDASGARGRLELTTLSAPPFAHVTAAGVWLLLDEPERALDQLRRYTSEAPGEAATLPRERILQPLLEDSAFQAMTEAPTGG